MGVAAPRAPVGGWGPGPPQKFRHRSLFVGRLLSRKIRRLSYIKYALFSGIFNNNV